MFHFCLPQHMAFSHQPVCKCKGGQFYYFTAYFITRFSHTHYHLHDIKYSIIDYNMQYSSKIGEQ